MQLLYVCHVHSMRSKGALVRVLSFCVSNEFTPFLSADPVSAFFMPSPWECNYADR